MRCGMRCGFTLVELMVVIAIIGVLLALLMPGLSTVWASADDYRCTTNLYFLSQAIAMRRGDVAMGTRQELRPLRWPTLLVPYLEDQGGTFMCPVPSVYEEPAAVPDDPGGSGSGGSGWGDSGYDGGSGSTNPNAFKAYPPITELCELRLGGGSTYQPMDAGPWTLKLSEEQAQAAMAQGWLGRDDSSHTHTSGTTWTLRINRGPTPTSTTCAMRTTSPPAATRISRTSSSGSRTIKTARTI
ncbi:MAG: prepilin-type N-terminal cleavage/methylation domain-containing protein [Planctomycetota bacterium]|nr:prepilin-type N-terminal cleavage/methylation domain-containing protein [Planctomycetota bacterium]